MDDAAGLVAQADRAAAAGDLVKARTLLIDASRGSSDPSVLMRLAGVQRATGQPNEALDSLRRVLIGSPRDFTALLMRASLLESLGSADAGEAWHNALSQKPSTDDLPGPMQAMVAHAEQQRAKWIAGRRGKLQAAMAEAEEQADAEEAKRIARFRTNVLRETKPYHSEPTHFHFPELTEREFHPRRLFPWIDELEDASDTIAAELRDLLASERAELVPYIQYDADSPLDQWRALNHSPDWSAIHLVQFGARIDANARHCPKTMALLETLPQPAIAGAGPNAMFSLLAPNTHIPPHVGVNNSRLVCHLPLIVPDGCWFRVGAETIEWQRGRAFVFDDTIEHEAMNPSDELRVVLIFDVWHPDLSEVERAAVSALVAAEQDGQSTPL